MMLGSICGRRVCNECLDEGGWWLIRVGEAAPAGQVDRVVERERVAIPVDADWILARDR